MSHGSDSRPATQGPAHDDPAPTQTPADEGAGTSSAPRRSLWHLPAMRLLAVYTLCGFTGFFATISALPAWIAAGGTSDSLAGFVTTTLLAATVSTQAMVPRMVARLGMTTTLAIGLAALGAPSLLFLVDGGYWWVLVICALRGIGFGSMTVLGAMLTARIVPASRRGEAIGIYGLAIALPNLLAVPGGVALVSSGNFWVVALLGAAPILGLPAVRALSRSAAAEAGAGEGDAGRGTGGAGRDTADAGAEAGEGTGDAGADEGEGTGPAAEAGTGQGADWSASTDPGTTADSAAERGTDHDPVRGAAPTSSASAESTAATRRAARRAALGPAFVLMVVTLTSGGFMTYLPIARPDGALATVALLVWGALGALTRWRIGPLADRSGLRALLPGSSVLSIVGICVVAAGLTWAGSGVAGWVVILAGSAILGMGFGGMQNLSLVAAFAAARQQETTTVSSVWNVGFDSGTAAGSGLVGLLILVVTIPGALALTAVLTVASLPLAIRAARPPRR